MKSNIYTVIAYRFGDRENHSYLVGVYTKKYAALKAAEDEEGWRGGKYVCEVIECVPDLKNEDGSPGTQQKIIKKLPKLDIFGNYAEFKRKQANAKARED